MQHHRQSGFTLLEILVALTVLGLIMLGLGQGLNFGLTAWTTQARTIAARDELGATERLLRGLIERMEPGEENEPPPLQGHPGAMQFRGTLPIAADLLHFRAASIALGVDGTHRLILRAQPNPRANPLAQPPPVIEEILLSGLDRIEISYWRRPSREAPAAWLRSWSGNDLPGLIRLRLIFSPGKTRQWPDIVVAPMREPSVR